MFAPARMRQVCLTLLSLAIAGIMAACNPDVPREGTPTPPPETENPNYKEAEANKNTHTNKALRLYLKAINERARYEDQPGGGSPESHRGAGEMYLQQGNGIHATYHFNEYKLAARTPAERRLADNLLARAQPHLARNASHGLARNASHGLARIQEDYARIAERCRQLEKVDADLRAQIRTLQNDLKQARQAQATRLATLPQGNPSPPQLLPPEAFVPAIPPPPQPTTTKPPRPPATYTVVRGDTLFGISAKVYGNGSHFKKIYDANRDKLKTRNTPLRAGWVLRIPPL